MADLLTWGSLKDRIALRAHKDLTRTDELTDVEFWARAGIEAIETDNSWSWLLSAYTISLVADTYEYAWPEGLQRFEVESFRYGGSDSYLKYVRKAENIDTYLGPQWRDSATTGGTPDFIVDFGRNFWLAPKPTSSFVADNPTLYFYGYGTALTAVESTTTLVDTTQLSIPLRFANFYVESALVVGLQQEDDPNYSSYFQVHQQNLLKMRSFDESLNVISESPLVPDFTSSMRY